MTDEIEVRRETLPATVDTPMAILRTAVEQGIDAASIEKLAELAWKQQDRDAAKEFADALRTFQEVCPSIRKDKSVQVTTKSHIYNSDRELVASPPTSVLLVDVPVVHLSPRNVRHGIGHCSS